MLQNLHTHTTFCDGKNTAPEMVEAAISLGFDSLGFSSHAPTASRTDWEMSDEALAAYIAQIHVLKSKYKGKIDILCGIELDYFSHGMLNTNIFDYSIGSVHMAFKDGIQIDFDHAYDIAKRNIDELFGGDSLAYAKLYYETLADIPNVIDFDFVGHFDVLTKFSEKHPDLIDVDSKEYKDVALTALHAVREKKEFFEVNTGAISRGHKTMAYPAPFILDEMKRLDCKLILTSDCHAASGIDCGFNEAREYIRSHGFDTLYNLTASGFKGEKI